MASLYKHQLIAINEALSRKHLLLVRSLGSGKTAIALYIVAKYLKDNPGPALFVGPAHLLQQYIDEANKWNLKFSLYRIQSPLPENYESGRCYCISYDLLRMHRSKITAERWPLVIIDEFQHGKNPDTKNSAVFFELRLTANVFIGMTGAPFQNGPYEFFNLISIIAGKNLRWVCEGCLEYRIKKGFSPLKVFLMRIFKMRRSRGPVIGIKNPSKLANIISRYVDYASPEQCHNEGNIPAIHEEEVYVELFPKEIIAYNKLLRKYRKRRDRYLFSDELGDDLIESACKRMSDLRQVLLCCDGEPSSKVLSICNETMQTLSNTDTRVLIFSNFVVNGVDIISRALTQQHLCHETYTGSINKDVRERIIGDFKSGRVRTIVLSPVGHEGLDLVGASHVFIADPHYNPERTSQIIARATRSGTNISQVYVKHFISKCSILKEGTIDEVITRISDRKNTVNKLLSNLLTNCVPPQ